VNGASSGVDCASRAEVDVVIVGAGPAGLSAALGLARCRRSLALFDAGEARNDVAPHTHGFFTRDGESPQELKRIGRAQLAQYGASVIETRVDEVARDPTPTRRGVPTGFVVRAGDRWVRARKLVLATGLKDVLPDAPGFAAKYGTSIWHCPHCDGWEARDRPLAVLARGREGVDLALAIRVFSDDVVLFTDGAPLDKLRRAQLARHRIEWHRPRITAFEGDGAQLSHVVLADGTRVARSGLFFHLGAVQRAPFAAQLGCRFDRRGAVKRTNRGEETNVPGLYVVGDASEDARLIVVAAAEGAKAAVHINKALRLEDDGRLDDPATVSEVARHEDGHPPIS
jgi:thioredoxin reductase